MPAPTTTTVTTPRRGGYGMSLDDRLFRLAVSPSRPLTIETAPLEPPRFTPTSNPEEAGEDEGLTFFRTQFDGGEGLFRAHVEGADANRFWDSKNVAVVPAGPGEFPQVTLLHTTATIEASATTGLRMAYDSEGGSLYLCEGTVLRRSDDPTAATPTFADDDPHAAEGAVTVNDVAVLGDLVYAALGANGIHRKSTGTWSHWSDTAATRIWSSKGRIVASDGVSLYEVVASGAAPSPLKTLASGLEWTSVVDGGDFVLAAASDGYVYAFATDTGSMVLATQSLFEDEQPMALGQTQGVVAVGTRQAVDNGFIGRLYVGALATTGRLDGMQLVKQWGDEDATVDMSPRRIIGTRDSLFTAVPDGTDTYLWRYGLSPLGLSRHLTIAGASASVLGLAAISGRLFASVESSGIWRETSTFASEGWLIGPIGDFFSAKDKTFVGATLEGDATDVGERIDLEYTVDPDALADEASTSWVTAISKSGSNAAGEVQIGEVARSIAGLVRLSSDGTSTPYVRSFGFRAENADGKEVAIITMPVNVSDQVERYGRHRVRIRGRGRTEEQALRAFVERQVTLKLYRPEGTYRGVLQYVGQPVVVITKRGSTTLVAQARFRGQVLDTSGADAGGFGTFEWGEGEFGG